MTMRCTECTIEPLLKEYGESNWQNLHIVYRRSEQREGLIRAKVLGAQLAKGEVRLMNMRI